MLLVKRRELSPTAGISGDQAVCSKTNAVCLVYIVIIDTCDFWYYRLS